MSISFSRLATVSCSTKRRPVIVDGKAGAPATHLTGLKCVPLHPVTSYSNSNVLAQTYKLETLVNLKETFVQGNPDITTGDILVIGSDEYPIRIVQDWPFNGDVRTQLILEQLVR